MKLWLRAEGHADIVDMESESNLKIYDPSFRDELMHTNNADTNLRENQRNKTQKRDSNVAVALWQCVNQSAGVKKNVKIL